jgi:hypothetical protein
VFCGAELVSTSSFDNWQASVQKWLQTRRGISDELANDIVSFFDRAFQNTRCPDRAWFGIHSSTVSLVVGGIFLAAVTRSGEDRGFWLLLDQEPPVIEGVEYRLVQSTRGSHFPLVWAHSSSLSVIPYLLANSLIWESFGDATVKILYSPRIASNRDSVQERRKKKRLSDFYRKAEVISFSDKIGEETVFREGAKYQVTFDAYERDPKARQRCIQHYGARCFICNISFGEVYGEIAKGFIHVHHLRPLSEIGSEYTVDPIEDLRPVCPNCHAVLHLRKPAFSIQDVIEFLRQKS